MNVEREYLYNRIQYISLRFSIIFTGRGYIAREKESAIRGAIGNALLDVYCSNNDEMNRDCLVCDNRKNCTVQNVLYSPFRIKPDFVTSGESIGYILECNNKKKEFSKGEDLQFNTILFGQCAEYAEILIDAVAKAGKAVIVISSEMPEVIGTCDRVYVINEGEIAGELQKDQLSQENIMKCIVNHNS